MLGTQPLFLPNLTLEGRFGLPPLFERPLDINYGLHITSLAFGNFGLHAGTSWLALEEDSAIPAVSVGLRQYLFSNHPTL